MKQMTMRFLQEELWWGGYVDDGHKMPLNNKSNRTILMRHNPSYNQVNPIFLSSKGRSIWCDVYYNITFSDGLITVYYDDNAELVVDESKSNLKDAYYAASGKHFAFNGKTPPKIMFSKPQYNTWIALMYEQNQEDILKYAQAAIKNGANGGLFIIDSGWQKYYGDWEFNENFANPKKMVQELHNQGFFVTLWIVPYVSPDSPVFRKLEKLDAFVKDKKGEIFLSHWWDGYSAVLDMTNPVAVKWLNEQCLRLQKDYGVDGFKFDAGDARLYEDFSNNASANLQSELWASNAGNYDFNELRACCKCGGLPIVQRIADRHHAWNDENGLSGLVAKCLTQSQSGYPYLCPDMVGGGLFSDFEKVGGKEFDQELFIRYCQASALMPMMQFSFDYLSKLDGKTIEICNKYADLHEKMGDYIFECAQLASKNGTPIIQNMAFAFDELHEQRDQFMLGEKFLVAPVLQKGCIEQQVFLPKGKWKYMHTGKEYDGGCQVLVSAPIDILPYFEKI